MEADTVAKAIAEAKRFISKAEDFQRVEAENKSDEWHTYNPRESGAVRRSSMDLSRALADLRQNR